MEAHHDLIGRDLLEQLRSTLHTNDLTRVREAYLERGGHVSFIT